VNNQQPIQKLLGMAESGELSKAYSRSPSPNRFGRSPSPRRYRSPRRRNYSRSPSRRSRSRSPPRRESYRPSRKSPFRAYEREKRHSTSLFVGNVPYHLQQRDLFHVFERCGPVRSVVIGANRKTGQSSGYCFVTYEDRRDAEDAFEKFQGYNLHGRRLRIDWDIGLERKQQILGNRSGGMDDGRRTQSPRYYSPGVRRGSISPLRSRSRSPYRKKRSRSPMDNGGRISLDDKKYRPTMERF
jgi:RNA recognition motif-containing protein